MTITPRQIEAYKNVFICGFTYHLAASAMGITERSLHATLNRLYINKPELKPKPYIPVKIISVPIVRDYGIKMKF